MRSAQQRNRLRSDLRWLGLALVLLLLAAAGWWFSRSAAREARAEALAGLPPFPSQHLAHERPASAALLPPSLPALAPKARDRLAAFATAPTANLAVIQVNALLHTPLYAKLKACLPAQLAELAGRPADGGLGVNLERDVDRVALIPGGTAVSGTFDPHLAEQLAGRAAVKARYRDAELYSTPNDGCFAQLGSLLLIGQAGGCEGLVDRALDTPDSPQSREVLESDLYTRTDLAALRDGVAQASTGGGASIAPILQGLGGLTLKANVWDDVAVSLDGTPRAGEKGHLEDLAALARFSVEASKLSASEDAAWTALLEKATVDVRGGHLQIDLALPAEALFERLQLPCAGRDGGS